MKWVHAVLISVFAKPGEDEVAIKQAMLSLVPFDIGKERLPLKMEVAEGFTNKIIIYSLTLEKERHTARFIEFLKSRLTQAEINQLATQENSGDGECCFYMRLGKRGLLQKEFVLTDSGECFHIKMSIAAFPKKREVALRVVKQIFS
jgi:RNA-binding protein